MPRDTYVIPSLADRRSEIDRIIAEYAEDGITELAVPRWSFPPVEHAWVREHASSSLNEIEKATVRLAALRASRNLSHADAAAMCSHPRRAPLASPGLKSGATWADYPLSRP